MQEIIGKVLLDHVPLVSAADDEIVDAVIRIRFQNVPQDRSAANIDHWFWPHGGLLAKTRTVAACKNHSFHEISPLLFKAIATISAPQIPEIMLIISFALQQSTS